jgi:hypothetical protein
MGTGDSKYMLGLLLILISKSLGVPPPRLGMPFLDSDTCTKRGLFISARVFFLYDAIHGWMMRWMDGKNFTKNDHDILYYM